MENIGLRYIIRLVRVREWWDKFFHLAGSVFLIGLFSDRITIGYTEIVGFLGAVICLLMGGYTMNDAADFDQDTAAGDENIPKREHSLILSIALLMTSLVIIYSISNNILPLVITAATILIGIEYSLPPVRFKERGIWGIIVGSATQKPALFLIFIVLIFEWTWLSSVLTAWLFCGGMLGMLGHQTLDYQNDCENRVRTFVALHGPKMAMILSMVCAAFIILLILAPLLFIPFNEAFPIICVLTAFSSVYLFKGLRSIKKIRAIVSA